MIGRIMVRWDKVPLTCFRGAFDALHSVLDINVETSGLVVDIPKYNFAITEELDFMQMYI